MIIVNGGLPRSGTVLVGAMICGILRLQGRSWQRYNPQERRHLPQFAEQVRIRAPEDPVLLVHTHVIDRDVLAALAARRDAVAFWNCRDPRDAMVSLQHVHDLTLDSAIHAMRIYADIAHLAIDDAAVQALRYEDFIGRPDKLARQLGAALSAELTEAQVEGIVEETSTDSHRKVMDSVAAEQKPGVRVIRTLRRTMREDPETLINDRHIQSGASGRWRQELGDADQGRVTAALVTQIRNLGYVP